MKRFLNGMGVFGSIILTIILTVLIFLYVIILNVKSVVSKNGITNTFKKIDLVETIKSVEDGVMWEDFKQLGEKLNLSEEEFEKILSSDKVKTQIGNYIGDVISSSLNDSEVKLTKEKIEEFLNVAVDEYNKVSDTKISVTEREKIINSFDEEMIANMNEEFNSINLKETVSEENIKYIELADNLLFGKHTLILLITIILIISLIALFKFSYYKWMPYVKVSLIINGILMFMIGLILFLIPLQDMEIILPIKTLLSIRFFITSAILFVLSVALSFAKKYLKQHSEKDISRIEQNEKREQKEELVENKVQVKKSEEIQNEKGKKDKKIIIAIFIILILLLIIILLIFARKGSYTITFDTNGGGEIPSIEVKNNEVVNIPDSPVKEGYKFVGWTNEEGKIITKGTKVTEDITLKAEWISNDAKSVTATFDTNGGNQIDNIIIEKGNVILLPVEPTKEGYIFVGWLNQNSNIITKSTVIIEDITLKAMWIKKGTKVSKVNFDTDGGGEIESIIIEKSGTLMLPVNPIKQGFVFNGWVDEDGEKVTENTKVNENITIKATWKDPYTCPSGCTPIEDGSKCTKTTTKDVISYTGCPSGTETVETFCSAHKRQVAIGFDEDMTYETAGIICSGNPTNFCVDYNSRYTIQNDSCPSGYFKYVYSPSGLDASYGCAKKYDKGGSMCPSGYTRNGNTCTKKETINCTAN